MGWASANRIFDPVAQALLDSGADDATVTKVAAVLIKTLQAGDWDTEDESLGDFADHPAIVAAFAANDVVFPCHNESAEGWWCEEGRDHDGDHQDYQGRTWPRAQGAT